MDELISIIVPVYNVEKYLRRCVESLQNQTYRNLEIILVDDGSLDHSGQICDMFARQDSRITVIHQENSGQGIARNKALEIATGTYVAFIDSDDWISPNHIANLYKAVKRYDADVAIGSYTAVGADQSERLCRTALAEGVYEEQDIRNRIILPLIGADENFHSDVQVNASSSMSLYSLKQIQKYDICYLSVREVVGEDLFFNLDNFYRAKKVVVVDEAGYYYFDNELSTSRKYDSERFKRTLEFKKVLENRSEFFGLKKEARMRIERSFLMKVRVLIRLIVIADGMSSVEKIKAIRDILYNNTVHASLMCYPIESYIPAIRILASWMRDRKTLSVYCLMKFREDAKRSRIFVRMLRKIGIGR